MPATLPDGRRPAHPIDRTALVTLLGLLALAALMRVPGLADRGTWDSDQGHDMLVLRSFVRDGVVPLLGPPTSIGDVHHGAWYYYLLAPAAWLTGGDSPLVVVTVIALMGVAAVGVTWWLARAIGGPVAGLAAGGLMALSAAAIDESTFIWNPNVIALTSALALAAAWRAWSTGDTRWWLVAAVGVALTMQGHVLGVALLPVIAALYVADVRRGAARRVEDGELATMRPAGLAATGRGGLAAMDRGGLAIMGLGGLAIVGLSFMPLLVHELSTGFSEVRAALAYLEAGRGGTDVALPIRIGIVGLRVVSWPLTGLITDGFVPGVLATAGVVGVVAWRWRAAAGTERVAIRWLGLALAWSTLFLAVAAPSLSAVTPGLPNDHYHAFADPMAFTVVGIGVAALARSVPGRAVAVAAVVGLIAWNVTRLPPSPHPDGGFPAAEAAAARVDAALATAGVERDAIVVLRSLPHFKSTESMAYPLVRLGRAVVAQTPEGVSPGSVDPLPPDRASGPFALILLCDSLFEASIGSACGGEAEAIAVTELTSGPLLERFEVAPGRWASVYGP